MKKGILIVLLAAVLLLQACTNIQNPDPSGPTPKVTLTHEGKLNQTLDDMNNLEDIVFIVKLTNFIENNIQEEDINISWKRNGLTVSSDTGDAKRFTILAPKIPGSFSVYAEVSFEMDGKGKVLTTDVLVATVSEQSVQLKLSTERTSGTTVSLVTGSDAQNILFNAIVTGSTGIKNIEYVVTDLSVTPNEVTTNSLELNGSETTFSIEFNKVGYYQVELQYTKFRSNLIYVDVNYGEFDILLEEGKKVQETDYATRRLSVHPIHSNPRIGEGVYVWYLNNEEIKRAHSNSVDSYVLDHTILTEGSYLYDVSFIPNDPTLEAQKTESFLIVNGVMVTTEGALLEKISDQETKAIILGNDIVYSKSQTLNINKELTIVGNGFSLESEIGLPVFIKVTHDHVRFSDIVIMYAQRYNLLYENVIGGYVEDIVFTNAGTGGMTDPGAGLYVYGSKVLVHNIKVLESFNSGIRIDPLISGDHVSNAIVKMTGTYEYENDELLFPIVSVRGTFEQVKLDARGYDEFVLPLQGDVVIRRWSNDANPMTWTLGAPSVTEYQKEAILSVAGISISVSMAGQTPEPFGLEFVYLFLNMFKQYGNIIISDASGKKVSEYYIIAHNPNLPGDQLVYSKDSTGLEITSPVLPSNVGEYRVDIYIGDQLYLGYFIINIVES